MIKKTDIRKRDYNISRLAKPFGSWDQDGQWFCDTVLETPPDFQERFDSLNDMLSKGSKDSQTDRKAPLLPGDKITLRFYLAPNFHKPDITFNRYEVIEVNGRQVDPTQLTAFSQLDFFLPKVINMSPDDGFTSLQGDDRLSGLTKNLLEIAYDNPFLKERDEKRANPSREDLKSLADHLNEKIGTLFNNSIRTRFRFEFLNEEKDSSSNESILNVSSKSALSSWISRLFHPVTERQEPQRRRRIDLYVEDEFRGETHLTYRGSGVIKIAYLASKLLDWTLAHQQNIILLDEPENSLHADSQHMLRKALEGLSQNSNIQVIYSTHSPSMINSLRAESIRLFKKEVRNNQVSSTVDNRPFDNNFLPVRTSLGLSPADSLLYAPVTVIVEGVTEVLCLPYLLRQFEQSGISGFEQSGDLLSITHFLNGGGSAYEFFCRLAKSQGNKVIIFADGDKEKEIKKLNMKDRHPDVEIILLDEGREFEQIVPRQVYFQALTEITGENTSLEAFDEWQSRKGPPEKQMFSKRVDSWMKDDFSHSFSKPEVMLKAVETANILDINPEPFKKLIRAIREAAP